MSGYSFDLNEKQKEKFVKLKEILKDVLQPNSEDEDVIKFLIARRFDVKKAEQMFRKDLAWRKENKVDTIMEWYKVPEVFKAHWAGGVSGLDNEGHVVYVADFGSLDSRGIVYSAKTKDIHLTNMYYMEELLQQQKQMSKAKLGHSMYGVTVIMDLENLGIHHLWKPGIDVFQQALMILEQHYPEVIHRLLVVKAPKIFPLAYSLAKPFLREDTRKKIKVLGNNWKDDILKLAAPDQVPIFWGGTKIDADGNPKCVKLIKPGGKIPTSFYLKGRESRHTMTSHEVSRGGNLEFKYEVHKPDSVMRYEFQTDSGDMKFGFDRVDDKGKKTPVLKVEKYNCQHVPEDGEIMISEPGTYVAKFENDSWTKSKKLSYWLELLEPTDEEPEFQEMAEEFNRLDVYDD